MAITESAVVQALTTVIYPPTQKNVVASLIVKTLKTTENAVFITLEVNAIEESIRQQLNQDCEEAIKKALGESVDVNVTFVNKLGASGAAAPTVNLLPTVKNIIAVVSGKGGVGKSTVSANLALSLSEMGYSVGLMDADIYGPSVPIMFGLRGARPKMMNDGAKGKIVPIEKYGIKVLSIGFLVDEKNAVAWRGPMASSALRQFVTDVHWGDLDFLIVDMPPGTGDIHLTLLQTVPLTGAVIVTTPQDVALADAKRGIAFLGQSQVDVPIIGLVENMAYFTPAELPENKYYIFGKNGGKNLASEYDLNFLGEIPLVQSIREGGDAGVPVVLSDDKASILAFRAFANNTLQFIHNKK